ADFFTSSRPDELPAHPAPAIGPEVKATRLHPAIEVLDCLPQLLGHVFALLHERVLDPLRPASPLEGQQHLLLVERLPVELVQLPLAAPQDFVLPVVARRRWLPILRAVVQDPPGLDSLVGQGALCRQQPRLDQMPPARLVALSIPRHAFLPAAIAALA